MENIWYYEYTVKIWDNVDDREEIRSGVVPAESMMDAMQELNDYYDNITEVQMLKAIVEGTVFEFQLAAEDPDCDFVFSRKI